MKPQMPVSSSTLKDFEKILTLLGKVSFGVVYKVRRKKDKNIYVLKQIDISTLNSKHRMDAINEKLYPNLSTSPYFFSCFCTATRFLLISSKDGFRVSKEKSCWTQKTENQIINYENSDR